MEFRIVERPAGAFQEPVRAEHVVEMCRRAFGAATEVVSAIELDGGRYNTTYRVRISGRAPVILRVAPEPGRQYSSEKSLMRNEYASAPFFTPIAAMMPRILFADWTHEIVARDYLVQTLLGGVSARDGLGRYPRAEWAPFYRQLGAVTAKVHRVRGERFGPVAGPVFRTWHEAVLSRLASTAADVRDAGLDAGDLTEAVEIAGRHREVFDEISEPRLLHGDLWTTNVLLAPDAPEPTITGVLDHDRSSWGDPAADWGSHVAGQKPEWAREAFWTGYGRRPVPGPAAALRGLIYRALHLGAIRLERHRLGRHAGISATYQDLRAVLDQLTG
ncbi:MAG TPA: aminoglycoside phosphotransferase family protein [Amycolatopsis sp.]|jgi:aminoglycoside phosphotransferase (APT) family kinase protein|nr:aminoglycoside phosphotransferase family protein [Amycolatopsis sp.]